MSDLEADRRLIRERRGEIGAHAARLMAAVLVVKGSTMLGLEAAREALPSCIQLGTELERELDRRGKE